MFEGGSVVEVESDSSGGGRLPRFFCRHVNISELTGYLNVRVTYEAVIKFSLPGNNTRKTRQRGVELYGGTLVLPCQDIFLFLLLFLVLGTKESAENKQAEKGDPRRKIPS